MSQIIEIFQGFEIFAAAKMQAMAFSVMIPYVTIGAYRGLAAWDT